MADFYGFPETHDALVTDILAIEAEARADALAKVEALRQAMNAGMADALTKDWPGDTRLRTAPAIVDYLLDRPEVRAILAERRP